ncbi:hypothetical protein C4565_05400 [Candidatus Parcubacteria bacterium]|nr:MAG: hypothetical protein C4565_05400 [Candidatus Parcubacteria bacterium]
MTYGIYGAGLIGLILIIVGAVIPSKRSAYICGYCGYIAETERELYNHYLICEKKKQEESER